MIGRLIRTLLGPRGSRAPMPPRPDQAAADHPANMLLMDFITRLHGVRNARVLELGTKRSQADRSTVHRVWAAADADYICSDFEDGLDVDLLADVHTLSQSVAPDSLDAVIACSVFEHVQRPWIGAIEIGKVLRPGGQVFVQTHFAFPIHGFPSDYWRYTREALETIFGADAGLRIVGSAYQYPVGLLAPEVSAPEHHEAYLNVCVVAEKPGSGEMRADGA